MDRRTALAAAAAIVVVTLTGGAAIAANLGLLADDAAEAGQLQPADAEITTILVEPDPAIPAGVAPAAVDDDRASYDDDGEEEHEDDGDDEHEYEGADDDD